MKTLSKCALFLFTSAVLFGCASNGFLMAKPRMVLYGTTYPAKDVDTPVEIYRTQRPNRPYVEIGEISCNNTNDEYALNQILMKARSIGADAIIILGSASTSASGVPIGGVIYSSTQQYGFKAVAIKYN